MIIGDYRYGGCELDGIKYAIVTNGGRIDRIRRIEADGNPVIWEDGQPMTAQIIDIIAAASYEPAPVPPQYPLEDEPETPPLSP